MRPLAASPSVISPPPPLALLARAVLTAVVRRLLPDANHSGLSANDQLTTQLRSAHTALTPHWGPGSMVPSCGPRLRGSEDQAPVDPGAWVHKTAPWSLTLCVCVGGGGGGRFGKHEIFDVRVDIDVAVTLQDIILLNL